MAILVRWRIYWRINFMSVGQIIRGTINNLLNKEEELYTERIAVCHSCKLLAKDKLFGEICNPSIYLNPQTDELSIIEKPGFLAGCGCVIGSKTRVVEAKCPLGKW